MPTVLRIGPYRFHFWSGDRGEPPHIHVERDQNDAKFCLRPVRLARLGGYNERELRQIEDLVREHERTILDAWQRAFGASGNKG